jgi:hypothetical protein
MSYQLRPARRSEAKPLIGLYAESGCGKTWSALMLARGFAGTHGRIVMIETESGRGEAYVDVLRGGYEVIPMRDHFSPRDYGEALTVAEEAQPRALIIDSASHEWEGAGGVLSMAAQNQEAGKKGPLVWQVPKLDHARYFMLRLLQTPIPLVIVCMRAKYPMIEQPASEGKREKEWKRSTELVPKQSEDILFELFVHGWIDREHCFHGTKYTRPDLRQVLLDGAPIDYQTGERLAAWAAAGSVAGQVWLPGPPPDVSPAKEPAPAEGAPPASSPPLARAAFVTRILAVLRARAMGPNEKRVIYRHHLGIDTTSPTWGKIELAKLEALATALEHEADGTP